MSNKVKCPHILVQKQSEAIAIHQRLKNGEKFGKLAKELSIDTGSDELLLPHFVFVPRYVSILLYLTSTS